MFISCYLQLFNRIFLLDIAIEPFNVIAPRMMLIFDLIFAITPRHFQTIDHTFVIMLPSLTAKCWVLFTIFTVYPVTANIGITVFIMHSILVKFKATRRQMQNMRNQRKQSMFSYGIVMPIALFLIDFVFFCFQMVVVTTTWGLGIFIRMLNWVSCCLEGFIDCVSLE